MTMMTMSSSSSSSSSVSIKKKKTGRWSLAKKLFGRKKNGSKKQELMEDAEIMSFNTSACSMEEDDDEASIFGDSIAESDDCGAAEQEHQQQDHIETCQDKRRGVQFNDDANQVITIPSSTSSKQDLHYSSADLARFKRDFFEDVRGLLLQQSNVLQIQPVLQQTHSACRQVPFETSKCVLTLEEEDELVDMFLQCQEQEDQAAKAEQQEQDPDEEDEVTRRRIPLCGLEKTLLNQQPTSVDASSLDNHLDHVLYHHNESATRRRVRALRKCISACSHSDKLVVLEDQIQVVLETLSRADRLYARLMAQANAYVLQQQEAQES